MWVKKPCWEQVFKPQPPQLMPQGREELPSEAFPKILTYKILNKIKWLFKLINFGIVCYSVITAIQKTNLLLDIWCHWSIDSSQILFFPLCGIGVSWSTYTLSLSFDCDQSQTFMRQLGRVQDADSGWRRWRN